MAEKTREEKSVEKLANVFKEWGENEVDTLVTLAKILVVENKLEKRKNGLGKLFDAQQEILKTRGCPEEILGMFQKKRNEVLEKASSMHFFQEQIPFIPVIPRSFMGIYGLMSMVHREEVGTAGGHLDPNEILTDVSVPENLYFIYGIENGTKTLGDAIGIASHRIDTTERLSLNAEEGLSLCIVTKTLDSHSVNCAATRRKGHPNSALTIFLSGNQKVVFAWNDVNVERKNDKKFGTPSCAERDEIQK